VADRELDFPFCICWANENWTRRWDGAEREVLLRQDYPHDHSLALLNDLIPLFRDPRYLRIDGAPVFLVYRVSELPDAPKTARLWRETAARPFPPSSSLALLPSAGQSP